MQIHKNKILITGATTGIGKALAEKFIELDNIVIAVGRNVKRLEEFSNSNTRVIPFKCDISKQVELENLNVFIKEEHADLNILINNAGIQYNYSFTEEPQLLDKIEHEVMVNFLSPLKLIGMLLPILQNNENSAIVNVSSGLGLVPKMDAPIYCGTKAGIHIFSKSLRYQLDKIKVFEIIPALVDTEMVAGRGKGKISPQALVEEFIKAFKRNKYEVNIGKIKLLRIINRISPFIADKIMRKGSKGDI